MKGADAEALARRYLEARGLRLIGQNLRAPGGELDLVMQDRDTLAVIEVRKRSHPGFGSAAESVDARKQARIVRATRAWLATQPTRAQQPVRFDVIAIDAQDHIDWIRDAFDAGA